MSKHKHFDRLWCDREAKNLECRENRSLGSNLWNRTLKWWFEKAMVTLPLLRLPYNYRIGPGSESEGEVNHFVREFYSNPGGRNFDETKPLKWGSKRANLALSATWNACYTRVFRFPGVGLRFRISGFGFFWCVFAASLPSLIHFSI